MGNIRSLDSFYITNNDSSIYSYTSNPDQYGMNTTSVSANDQGFRCSTPISPTPATQNQLTLIESSDKDPPDSGFTSSEQDTEVEPPDISDYKENEFTFMSFEDEESVLDSSKSNKK